MTLALDTAAFEANGHACIRGPEIAAAKARAEAAMLDTAKHIAKRVMGANAPDEATLGHQLAAMCAQEADQAATRACYEVFPTLPEVIALINAPVFLDAVKAAGLERPVAGTNPLVRLDRPGDVRFTTPLHQDYWYSLLSDRAVVIWMALGPLDDDMVRWSCCPAVTNAIWSLSSRTRRGMSGLNVPRISTPQTQLRPYPAQTKPSCLISACFTAAVITAQTRSG
ncbi:hypothetical protein NHF45_11765 [Maricaulaceae bacterium NA33B04]|nr:hypothetical protein [Maricaulaceae bacterium NA33B04]